MTLNQEKRFVLRMMETTNDNLFITGKAGTGKSFLLNFFLANTRKNVVVLAPTGTSALDVGGTTIHKFFGLKPELQVPEKIDGSVIFGNKRDLFRNVETIVIDEISMVRSDLMDTIDYILKRANGNNEPFGGKQIIAFGDLYQLPPVVKNNTGEREYLIDKYGGFFFFDIDSIKEKPFKVYELTEVYRQKDTRTKLALDNIREGKQTSEDLKLLNSRTIYNTNRSFKDDYITLTTTNASADSLNQEMLNQINSPVIDYWAWIDGKFDPESFPTLRKLSLKKGARVIMLNNDSDGRWTNGSFGEIVSCGNNTIEVRILNSGETYTIYKNKWEQIEYFYNKETKKIESKVVAEFHQLPVKLAWAITIHKSQGKTYEKVEVDLGNGTFACGQTYVAVSRIKSLEGLHLKRPIQAIDIKVDNKIKEYMATFNVNSIENCIKEYKKGEAVNS